jgi:hypothetical protein
MITLKTNFVLPIALISIMLSGCDIKKNTAAPDGVYTTIYNDNDMNSSYYPIGIAQENNGQLLMVAGLANDTSKYTWTGTYIMEAANDGKFLWENSITSGFVNPVPNLISNGGNTYFICMDEITLQAHLMMINAGSKNATVAKTFDDIIYPLYTYQTSDGGLLIVSYDRTTRSTQVTRTDASFNEVWHKNFNVMEDAEAKVISHLSKLGQQFPFFAGEIKTGNTVNQYYVNSFYNYSFSLLFLDAGTGNQTGVVNGYRYDGAISAAMHLDNKRFSISRYTFGDNYILPQVELNTSEVATTNDLAGTKFPELNANAKVLIKEKDAGDAKRIVFITSTKVGQLSMYQFDTDSSKVLKSNYYGHSNPIEIASAINSSDGGMLLLCRIIVAGRFPRMALYKVSAGEFQ